MVELHGCLHVVKCMSCGHEEERPAFQQRLFSENPELADQAARRLMPAGGADPENAEVLRRPDGDVEMAVALRTSPPACLSCGGINKPDVVFFGDSVPPATARAADDLMSSATGVLCLGTSLATWSSFRLVQAASQRGVPVAVVNVGPTRADKLPLALRVESRVGETMEALARDPRLGPLWRPEPRFAAGALELPSERYGYMR